MLTSTIYDRERKVLPETTKVSFDTRKSLFDGIQIWGVRRQKDKLALGFILNKCPDLLRMMNATIVQNEDTSRTGVWVCKRNDQLPEKFDEACGGDRAWNDIVCDDSVHGENWEDRVPLCSDKKSSLHTSSSN
jgi:hypothetical protein